MAKSFAAAALGAIVGLLVGGVTTILGGIDQYVYLRNTLSVALCIGLGAIAGAVAGAAGAVVDAIRQRNHDT
jgi:hypothetical protein